VPRKTFVAGEILTALDVNTNLMDQAVMTFADATERDAEIPSPLQGMVTYLKDTDRLEKYTTDWVDAAPGKILQVVSTSKTGIESLAVSAQTFTANIPGLEATITPTFASSKVLVTVSLMISRTTNLTIGNIRLMRGTSAIGLGGAAGNRTRVSGSFQNVSASGSADHAYVNITFEDSPNTTSATTYGVQAFNSSGSAQTIFINRGESDADAIASMRGISTITLMEVAG
jgi:hypothetical protein